MGSGAVDSHVPPWTRFSAAHVHERVVQMRQADRLHGRILVSQLKGIVRSENLRVKTGLGGASSRTKMDFIEDIWCARACQELGLGVPIVTALVAARPPVPVPSGALPCRARMRKSFAAAFAGLLLRAGGFILKLAQVFFVIALLASVASGAAVPEEAAYRGGAIDGFCCGLLGEGLRDSCRNP